MFGKVADELDFMSNRIRVQKVETDTGSEASTLVGFQAGEKFTFFAF